MTLYGILNLLPPGEEIQPLGGDLVLHVHAVSDAES